MSSFKFAGTALKNLFSKPATSAYPDKPKDYYDNARGHIQIDIDVCIFCGLCSRKCPTGAISVSKNDKSWSIARSNCIQCGACCEGCPKKCLFMKADYTPPSRNKIKDEYNARVSDNQ